MASSQAATPSSSLLAVTSSAAPSTSGWALATATRRQPAQREHRQVVGHVAEDQHVRRVDAELVGHDRQPGRLVDAGRGDLDVAEPGLGDRGQRPAGRPRGRRRAARRRRCSAARANALIRRPVRHSTAVVRDPLRVAARPRRSRPTAARRGSSSASTITDSGPTCRLQQPQRLGQAGPGDPPAAQDTRSVRVALVEHAAALGEHEEVGARMSLRVQLGQPRRRGRSRRRPGCRPPGPCRSTCMDVRRHGVVAADQRAVEVGGDQLRAVRAWPWLPPRPPAPVAAVRAAGSNTYARAARTRPRDSATSRSETERLSVAVRARPGRRGRAAAPWAPRTEPSGCWWFSRIGTIHRVVASVPLSVAAICGLPSVVAVADVEPAGLERGAVRRRGDLAVAALRRHPRLAVVLAGRAACRGRRRPRRSPGRAPRPWPASPPPRRAGAGARRAASSGRQYENISTLSNWCTRMMPRMSLPYEPASRRKHDDQPAYRARLASRSRISFAWYAASGTSDVPTRYRSSASSR